MIAIDGPAGSGKSSVTRCVAEHLGADYLDTGGLYRAVTAAVLAQGVDPGLKSSLTELLGTLHTTTTPSVSIAGYELSSPALRTPEVEEVVPMVAASLPVREFLRRVQREWATSRPLVVVEGRDIGTVVFPDARLKVFLTADLPERARRRSAQANGTDAAAVRMNLAQRDSMDTARSHSPMKPADGAAVIDTTTLSLDEVVERVLALWREVTSHSPGPSKV